MVQRQAHESTKNWLIEALTEIGGDIQFIRPPKLDIPQWTTIHLADLPPLDASVFSWHNTAGVQIDIQRDGCRIAEGVEIVYGVASQFNGCEAALRMTIPPGEAFEAYRGDNTQGPQAQLQFGEAQVEILNAAGNLGFNALVYVLNEATKDALSHGYFTPTHHNIDQVIAQLKAEGDKIEYICIRNTPTRGNQSVYQFLAAAPALGMYAEEISAHLTDYQSRELQFLSALYGYRAQFAASLELAQENRSVIFKPTAVGLGVFGNEVSVVAKAFYAAASEIQEELKAKNVRVELQVFRGTGPAYEMARALRLQESRS